jgi:hypothetical protein
MAALVWGAAGVSACGDDTVGASVNDAGVDATFDSNVPGSDSSAGDDAGASDAGHAADADATAPPSARLLLSYNASQSELVAFGLQSKAVDGRLKYSDFIGTSYVTPSAPWLLEQGNDLVGLLDLQQPWVVQSSWNVAMNDFTDAGYAQPYSDPQAVVVGTDNKAYVLRYNRNLIAVIDTSRTVDAGAPIGSIDLSGEVQANGDGYVEMTAGVYDPASQRVYVLLANINRLNVACNNYCLICADTQPTIVAIDTTTDTLADLNGSSPGASIALQGYAPTFGPGAMAFDAANNRLLVLETGCNQPADGGVGPLVKREIDEVSLTTGQTQMLLDLSSNPNYPQALFYVDAHHAIVQLDTAYAWDPTTTSLGPAIPNAPDAFALDADGNLVGISGRYAADGGFSGYDVVSVSAGDGGVTKLGADPFSLTGGFIGGVQLWPAY